MTKPGEINIFFLKKEKINFDIYLNISLVIQEMSMVDKVRDDVSVFAPSSFSIFAKLPTHIFHEEFVGLSERFFFFLFTI